MKWARVLYGFLQALDWASSPHKNVKLNSHLILPLAGHLALTVLLYVGLTLVRAPKVWGIGRRPDGTSPWAQVEPRISANLSNQFEWPVLFYVACLLLIQNQSVTHYAVALAWMFTLGRVAHSCVQVFTSDVRLRGVVFTINFIATLGLWLAVLIDFKIFS